MHPHSSPEGSFAKFTVRVKKKQPVTIVSQQLLQKTSVKFDHRKVKYSEFDYCILTLGSCVQDQGRSQGSAVKLSKLHFLKFNEPPYDKTIKMTVRPAKNQISLGIRPV